MQHEFESSNTSGISESNRYLIFSLGTELYGSPLQLIREVLKNGEVKEVPYMKTYFKGVINVRGKIISVLDLREKFGLKIDVETTEMMLVIEKDGHYLATIVDEVLAVGTIEEGSVDRNPTLSTKIPLDFFLGIGQWKNRLVNLIDIGGVMSKEDFSTISRTKEVA